MRNIVNFQFFVKGKKFKPLFGYDKIKKTLLSRVKI